MYEAWSNNSYQHNPINKLLQILNQKDYIKESTKYPVGMKSIDFAGSAWWAAKKPTERRAQERFSNYVFGDRISCCLSMSLWIRLIKAEHRQSAGLSNRQRMSPTLFGVLATAGQINIDLILKINYNQTFLNCSEKTEKQLINSIKRELFIKDCIDKIFFKEMYLSTS